MTNSDDYPFILHTERLVLKLVDPSRDEDCDLMLRVYNEIILNSARGPIVPVPPPQKREQIREKHITDGPKAELCTRRLPAYGGMFFCMFSPGHKSESANSPIEYSEGAFVGVISCLFRPGMPIPDFGYGIFPEFQGKGYVLEGGREVLRYWREEIGVKELCCWILDANARSMKTAESLGFVKCGGMNLKLNGGEPENTISTTAFVLPGMTWPEFDEEGRRMTFWPEKGIVTYEPTGM